MNWYLDVITKNYANFNGRARRQEYWLFLLFQITIILALLFGGIYMESLFDIQFPYYILGIYYFATIIPTIALAVRRLHDTGKSGAAYFVKFIPAIGGIIFLILMVLEGDRGRNKYGEDPKAPKSFGAYDNLVSTN
ncbi:DUF805 domain-containing protein [Marinigracilibium pacificum]|uniref:DUF805 domain-containing protein n=1 Tax=Marinigracilibium pacificum TaxID=2729599 RepID=A0A848IVV6_9BACT|nr:DUF805 domain-containing protein [Marinigracilibium pacificum]NMM47405.1 DUF805 domain-containing protein [Marinigracilibium pacificum]